MQSNVFYILYYFTEFEIRFENIFCNQSIDNQSINQSIIYLLMTHQGHIKQWSSLNIKTRRAGQPGTRCTYGCPYKKKQKLKTTAVKRVQVSKVKAIKWHTTKW